jgi:hypothetical protein
LSTRLSPKFSGDLCVFLGSTQGRVFVGWFELTLRTGSVGSAGFNAQEKQAEPGVGFVPIGLVTEWNSNRMAGGFTMVDQAVQAIPLSDLEARQDEILRRLEELDCRVSRVLDEWVSEKAVAKG